MERVGLVYNIMWFSVMFGTLFLIAGLWLRRE